jgi:hypothetical protein
MRLHEIAELHLKTGNEIKFKAKDCLKIHSIRMTMKL